MQRRFHADLRIRAIESLLFERVPLTRRLEKNTRRRSRDTARSTRGARRAHLEGDHRRSPRPLLRQWPLFAHGHQFRRRLQPLERFRSHPLALRPTLDAWGSFLYIRDTRSRTRSGPPLPNRSVGSQGSDFRSFLADRAEFHRHVFGIESVMEVTVAAEDDVELRRVTVTNRSVRTRQLWNSPAMSELALAPARGR